MEQEHKRRPRYKGTHPRTFQEKYKEHDPENYRSDVEKIIKEAEGMSMEELAKKE